jgi:hypothetical protein
MAPIARSILAGVAGLVTAFVTVAVVEALAHLAVPRGTMPAATDRAAVAAYIASMPVGAFVSIALAWFLGVVAGTWVAVRIARSRPRTYAALVGGVIALSAVLNFVLIPHPAWFIAMGLAAIVAATIVGMRLASRMPTRRADA